MALPALAQRTIAPTALPSAPQVTAGAASVASTAARMDVTQISAKAVINWQSFDVGKNAQVNFNQPNASAVALNRVVSALPSQIDGRLTANGQIYLINAAGVYFGNGARVDVGGLVASTLNIRDADFLDGKYRFTRDGATGKIINEGQLTAKDGGYIALLAPEITNNGTIVARMGTIALGAGDAVTLDFSGDQLVSMQIDPATIQTLIENKEAVLAEDGLIVMSSLSANDLAAGVMNLSGTIKAKQITANSAGGHIAIKSAKLDANGSTGGGKITLGGSPDTSLTKTLSVDSQSSIEANALDQGKGGVITLWSSENTDVAGKISATGANGGQGGFVETSAHGTLRVAQAPVLGAGGTWLLDPNDIVIQASGSDANISNTTGISSTGDSAVITTGTIETALNAGTNVSISTGTAGTNSQLGNITVADPIQKTLGGAATLTLTAHNNIYVNAPITSTSGALNVTLRAGHLSYLTQIMSLAGGVLDTGPSIFAGTWSGSFSGDDSGVIQWVSSDSGTATISGYSDSEGYFSYSASFIPSGVQYVTSGSVPIAVALQGQTFTGSFNPLSRQLSGTISDGFSTIDFSLNPSVAGVVSPSSGSPSSGSQGSTAGLMENQIKKDTVTRQPIENMAFTEKTIRYFGASTQLANNPAAADMPTCVDDAESEQGLCIPIYKSRQLIRSNQVEQKHAFLIGINDYKNPGVSALETPLNDIQSIADLLQKRYGFRPQILKNPTKQEIARFLNQALEQVGPNDSVLIFYAGHGYMFPNGGMGYWLPADAETHSANNWLSNTDISRYLALFPSKQTALISDSCFSGSLTQKLPVAEIGAADKKRILSRRSVVIMSSGDEEPVSDEGFDGHSVFAWSFLKHLGEIDGLTPSTWVFPKIRQDVVAAAPQEPQLGAALTAGHEQGTDYLLEPISLGKSQ